MIAPVPTPQPGAVMSDHQIRTVLLATDLGRASADAAERAIDLAGQLRAELLIVSVIDDGRSLADGKIERPRVDQVRDRRNSVAQALVIQARRAGVAARFLIWQGEPGESITAAAQAESCDLIVMGTHGRTGLRRSLAGSVSDYVVRNAPCPVLIVRPTA
jgi:universal stress protein A